MKGLLIGCGHIGGSMVLDLKNAGFLDHVTGIDVNPDHLSLARKMGLIDEESEVGRTRTLTDVDIVIIAIPVNAARILLPIVLDNISLSTVIMDVGSTKAGICDLVKSHPNRGQFVATHPIAGREDSGPEAAVMDLFRDRIALICDQDRSSERALKLVNDLYKSLGSRIIEMDSLDHDKHVAYVSHLSHISSFTLGLTVLDIEQNEKNIHLLAGSGFDSTVRLAKSSPEMWEPIFLQNARDIDLALKEYIEHLQTFRDLINRQDSTGLLNQMRRANEIRRVLDGDKLRKDKKK